MKIKDHNRTSIKIMKTNKTRRRNKKMKLTRMILYTVLIRDLEIWT